MAPTALVGMADIASARRRATRNLEPVAEQMDTMAMSTKNYPAIPFKEDDRTLRAFEFYGGCPELIIPDNLRSGINPVCPA